MIIQTKEHIISILELLGYVVISDKYSENNALTFKHKTLPKNCPESLNLCIASYYTDEMIYEYTFANIKKIGKYEFLFFKLKEI